MEEKFYNKKDSNSKLLEDLKNLEKIKAPDNFEFNLMTKIKNGQYNSELKKGKNKNLLWVFIPSTALVLSAIILFFVITDTSTQIDNPFGETPKLRENGITRVNSDKNKKEVLEKKDNYQIVLKANDVISKEILKKNIDENNSVELDNYIDNVSGAKGSSSNTRVVNQSNSPSPNGIYVKKNKAKPKTNSKTTKPDSVNGKLKTENLKKE